MATVWERLQAAAKAAVQAWNSAEFFGMAGYGGVFGDGLSNEQRQRIARYRLLRSYYNGNHKRPLKIKPGNSDDNVLINDSRRIVNKSAAFLFGKDITFQLPAGLTSADSEFAKFWDQNKKMSFLYEVALNGGVLGDYYVQILPPDVTRKYPRLINLDPCIVFPQYNPNDIEEVLAYELRWHSGDVLYRQIWSQTESGPEGQPGIWMYWTERLERSNTWVETVPKQTWPYLWCPIHHGSNLPNPNEFFGVSDLEDADLNDAVNFTASNLNKIIRRFASPILKAAGFGNKQGMDLNPDNVMYVPSGGSLELLEMKSTADSSVAFYRSLRQAFYQVSSVPMMDPETMTLGAQSGFALKVLYGDLLEKTEVKRRLYGDVLEQVCKHALEMMGYLSDEGVEIQWQDPLPADVRSDIAALQFDLDAGIASKETVSGKRGYSWEDEQKKIAEEKKAAADLGSEILESYENGPYGNPTKLKPGEKEEDEEEEAD